MFFFFYKQLKKIVETTKKWALYLSCKSSHLISTWIKLSWLHKAAARCTTPSTLKLLKLALKNHTKHVASLSSLTKPETGFVSVKKKHLYTHNGASIWEEHILQKHFDDLFQYFLFAINYKPSKALLNSPDVTQMMKEIQEFLQALVV